MREQLNNFNTLNDFEEKKTALKNELTMYSSASEFSDDAWIMDKLKKGEQYRKSNVSLYFSNIPEVYRDYVKFFILSSLGKGKSLSTVGINLYALTVFFKFLSSEYNSVELNKINKGIILQFEMFLHEANEYKKSTKESIWTGVNLFFKVMVSWEGMPREKVVEFRNPFSRTSSDRLNSQKYIPVDVIEKIDKIFFEEDLHHYIRTLYWICRLIPSRINEVLSVPINCLKVYRENEYTLTLHMYKQNGGYIRPELRIIHLKYEDMGKYLIDLIKKQQEIATELQSFLPEQQQGFLFTYEVSLRGHIGNRERSGEVVLLNAATVRKKLNMLLELHNVLGEGSEIYHLSTHQLRHNAITDRIYEGFSLLEIRDMTAHKSNSMLEGSYIHPDKAEIQAIGDRVNDESSPAGGVYFQGKIINADNPIVVKRLLAKPRAHKIGRLGICSDITGCKNDMFECFSCSYFVPNGDELEYFEEQVEQWEKKVRLAGSNELLKENAEYNLRLSKGVLTKIKESIEREGN